MSRGAVRAILSPCSVAVVGATDRMQYGGRLLANLLASPPPGGVWPVNPNRSEVMGHPCYPSVQAVPADVDLAAIIVPSERVISVLEDCAAKGVRAAIVISAGFAELGTEAGLRLQADLRATARRTGVRVVGPNCFGVANLAESVHPASHFTLLKQVGAGCGGIALLSHSGASAFIPIAAAARDRQLDLEYVVSSGNEADLDAADFIDYWTDDPRVRAVALLLEGIREGSRFLAAARRATLAGKPVIVCKIGRSEVGARAAATHTAALTGSWSVYRAAFRWAGVTLADDYDDLVELAYTLGHSRMPEGAGVGVLSNSGGVSGLVGDRLGELGLRVPELSAAGREAFEAILQGRGYAGNPADVTGHFKQETFGDLTRAMLAEPEIDILVTATYGETAARFTAEAFLGQEKPVFAMHTERLCPGDHGLGLLRQAGVPVFFQPGKVARAVRALVDFASARRRLSVEAPPPAQAARVADRLVGAKGTEAAAAGALAEADALALLAEAGLPVVRHARCENLVAAEAAARKIGYPVVVKVDSPDILHKTEAGAVCLGVSGPAELTAAFDAVLAGARAYAPGASLRGVLVAEQVRGGVEVLIGVTEDPSFGPVLLLGLGGIEAEALGAVTHRLCPVDLTEAESMIDEVPGLTRLLSGFRGKPPGDRGALAQALVTVSRLAAAHAGEIRSLDINPLVVLPSGRSVVALDAVVQL